MGKQQLSTIIMSVFYKSEDWSCNVDELRCGSCQGVRFTGGFCKSDHMLKFVHTDVPARMSTDSVRMDVEKETSHAALTNTGIGYCR